MFNTDVVFSSPKAAECQDDCVGYDFVKNDGTRHGHCARCGAMVQLDGDMCPIDGGRCHGENFCADCMTTNGANERVCRICADEENRQRDDEDLIETSLIDVERGLTQYLECLRTEMNAVKIKETFSVLNRIEDLWSTIHRETKPNVERAYGQQQSLPGAA